MSTPNAGIADPANVANPPSLLARVADAYRSLARREMMACLVILVLTLGLRAALLPWLPVPQPTVHDELSYLVAADTYAHGRLANPQHRFWEHFETFQVLQQPTYASKYQPLQGLVLAFGQKFFGEPWFGVYLTTGLLCAAICWMLQAWIAPEWALLGGLLFALRVGVLSYWMNSYFPGSITGLGGGLTLGAMARILWKKQFGHSITWALGLTIVALSRPYDAAVLGCATAAILLWFLRKSRTLVKILAVRVGLPAMTVLGLCAAGIAYNNIRVTGHALTLPDEVYERQYAVVSMGVFSIFPLGAEPAYREPAMREIYAGDGVREWSYAREHPFVILLIKLYVLDNFFFPLWPLLIPVLLFPYDLNTPEEHITVLLCVTAIAMTAPLILSPAHYVAVFAGIFYLRFLQSLARLSAWRPWNKPAGPALAVLLVGLLLAVLCNRLFSPIRTREEASQLTSGRDFSSKLLPSQGLSFAVARQMVTRELEKQAGRQLVLVRYAPGHDPYQEWIYNKADIDAAPIVWAHEMSPAQDRLFLEYFHDRRVWLLEPDRSPPNLSPYPSQVSP